MWVAPRASLRRISLQWKFSLLVVVGLLVLFGLFAFLGSRLADDSAGGMAAERLSTARLTAVLLDQQFEEQFEELEWDAVRLGAGDPAVKPARGDLLRPNEPLVTGLRFVDATGVVRWSDPAEDQIGADLSNAPVVNVPLTTGERYASGVVPGRPSARGPQARVLFYGARARRTSSWPSPRTSHARRSRRCRCWCSCS